MNLQKICQKASQHPKVLENYILLSAFHLVSKNQNLKNTNCQTLIIAFDAEIERRGRVFSVKEFLDRYFEEHSPSDKLIHCAKDCMIAGLMLFLSKKEDAENAHAFFLEIERCDYEALFERHSSVHRMLFDRNCMDYRITDSEGQQYIRELVYSYAKRHRISDKTAAGLFTKEQLRFRMQRIKYFYGILLLLLVLILSVFLIFYCGILPYLFLAIPIFMFGYELVRLLASFTLKAPPILKIKKKSESASVLTVITSVLSTKKDADLLFERLYKMRRMNADGPHLFGLLLDLPESDCAEKQGEAELLCYTAEKVKKLNQIEDCFTLFIRKRSYLPKEQKYLGWERKRGAILQLTRALRSKDRTCFSVFIGEDKRLLEVKYILTLDTDTDLRYGAVDTLMRGMLHPYNKPIVQNGVVVSGYGILQPRIVTGVASAGTSPFSLLHAGSGGFDSYQNTVFDFYQCVFGKTAFCGKGIFDVEVFLETIDGAFPENRILSHDILEGTRMRCGAMTELALTDSIPANALSYYKRQHRWLRGDYQNLPFLFPRLPGGKNNPIDKVSRFMLLMNILRALTPIFALSALFFSTLLTESQCAVFLLSSFAYLLFPLFCSVIRSIRYVGRKFYSSAMQNVWQTICQTLFTLSSLAHEGYLSANALIKSAYRSLISEKNLLEWVTADQSERKISANNGKGMLLIYLKNTICSIVVGLLMLIFAHGGVVRLFGLAFLLFPFICYLLSKPHVQKEPSVKEKKRILRYARDSFAYFDQFVTEKDHFLPPDNFQELPEEVIAHRTSPTNIGLYLASLVAGYDMQFIGEDELLLRLSRTIDSVIALPKYRGHLYNWYDTINCEILGQPYVSSVDSGNFVISLIAVKEAIKFIDNTVTLTEKINALIDGIDFSFLYDRKKKLLAIGYDPIKETLSENCYDLYASEARSGYIFAIAKGQIPIECWGKLHRPITVKNGFIGILSWSGTAFEYFMPALFFPIYRNTLQYEMLCFAMSAQMDECYEEGVWGKSESCYFRFDEQMNYQYRAFGSPLLALDREAKRHDVVAPYASLLMLALDKRFPIENLKQIEKLGGYGRYGFYDAIDFTPMRVGKGYAVIRCYMSHHIGMGLIAADNALSNGVFQKRVMANTDISAVSELLTERIPVDAPKAQIVERAHERSFYFNIPEPSEMVRQKEWVETSFALLDIGTMSVIASADGYIGFRSKERLITPPYSARERFAIRFTDKAGERHDLLQNVRLFCGQERMRMDGEDSEILLSKEEGGISLTVLFKKETDGGVLEMETPILLCGAAEYESHPAFQLLSVEGYFENGVHYFEKRSNRKAENTCCFAVSTAQTEGVYSSASADQHPSENPPSRTLCRIPMWRVKENIQREKEMKRTFFFSLSKKRSEIASNPPAHAEKHGKRKISKEHPLLVRYTALLLNATLAKGKLKEGVASKEIKELWQFGLSGDYPILLFTLTESKAEGQVMKMISRLVRAQYRLYCAGIKCNLVFFTKESDRYYHPLESAITAIVTEGCGQAIFKKSGGVHILSGHSAEMILPSFAKTVVTLDQNSIFETLVKDIESCLDKSVLPKRSFNEARLFEMDERSVRIYRRGAEEAPWSYIYCNSQFGTLLTDKSLGFSWFRNAGELRLTPFSGKEREEPLGELLWCSINGHCFDLISESQRCEFLDGYALYSGEVEEMRYRVSVSVDKKLPVKIITLSVKTKNTRQKIMVEYCIEPCLHRHADQNIIVKKTEDALFFKRTALYNRENIGMYLFGPKQVLTIDENGMGECFFLLGVYNTRNDRCYYHVRGQFSEYALAEKAMNSCGAPPVFRLESGLSEIDLFFNRYLVEQVKRSRLYGRTGYSQPGGAYGFRDQLQDAMNLVCVDERILRLQIYRAAAHQFTKGDVQHWWHPLHFEQGKGDPGVRTECSDDLLFLVYACAEYLEKTLDFEILSKQIRYLEGISLKNGEERYDIPKKSDRKESLYKHCIRALDLALERREEESGLSLIGSCDWNDGFSEIRGTSVWLTQFLYLTIEKFLPYCTKEDAAIYREELPKLKNSIENQFTGDRYLRAYFKNGHSLGSDAGRYCKIDLLTQAFSVFIGINERSEKAMQTAYDRLFDEKLLLFRLFEPSFDKDGEFPGYLGGYCPGFRENGGQYTHAALWGAKAFFLLGAHDQAMNVLFGCNPLYRQNQWGKSYALEPYSVAGDIYYAVGHQGRGGWSQYTGAAGWYYSILLYDLVGYRQTGNCFSIHPRLSTQCSAFRFLIRKSGTEYTVEVRSGEIFMLTLDGKQAKNQFFFDKKRHIIKIVLAKS